MASSISKLVSCFFFLLQLIFLFSAFSPANADGLRVGFYDQTCPKAEVIVKNIVSDTIKEARTVAAPLLRMFFHDCFVRGCDGSVLLDLPNNQSEKSAAPNLTLRGFQIIDKIKTALEKECPGVVSCADIIALVARDAVVALDVPSWEVETGRRDGRVSNVNEALLNIPSPLDNISRLISDFGSKGLDEKDLAVLSGAHTIGISRCSIVNPRLYNFTGKGDSDPSLDPEYAQTLRLKCKPGNTTTLLEMDPGSFKTFDYSYYPLVAKRRGLFVSDAALLDNPETKSYVLNQGLTHGSTFFKDFATSMVKISLVAVKKKKKGEVRKMCRKVN